MKVDEVCSGSVFDLMKGAIYLKVQYSVSYIKR